MVSFRPFRWFRFGGFVSAFRVLVHAHVPRTLLEQTRGIFQFIYFYNIYHNNNRLMQVFVKRELTVT